MHPATGAPVTPRRGAGRTFARPRTAAGGGPQPFAISPGRSRAMPSRHRLRILLHNLSLRRCDLCGRCDPCGRSDPCAGWCTRGIGGVAAGEAAGEDRVASVVPHPHLALKDVEQPRGVAQVGIAGAVRRHPARRPGAGCRAPPSGTATIWAAEHAFQRIPRTDIAHRRDRGADPVGPRRGIKHRRHVERERQVVSPASHGRGHHPSRLPGAASRRGRRGGGTWMSGERSGSGSEGPVSVSPALAVPPDVLLDGRSAIGGGAFNTFPCMGSFPLLYPAWTDQQVRARHLCRAR